MIESFLKLYNLDVEKIEKMRKIHCESTGHNPTEIVLPPLKINILGMDVKFENTNGPKTCDLNYSIMHVESK